MSISRALPPFIYWVFFFLKPWEPVKFLSWGPFLKPNDYPFAVCPNFLRLCKIQFVNQLFCFKVVLWSNFYPLIFWVYHAVYCLQISALVPDIFKFEKWVEFANEMTDDVTHWTQYYVEYINRATLANLQRTPMDDWIVRWDKKVV